MFLYKKNGPSRAVFWLICGYHVWVARMKVLFLAPLAGILLSGCAMWRNPNDPARNKQSVVVVNSMTWPNAGSGKLDGTRTVWQLQELGNNEEIFPLAQIKQCPDALPCAWGVLLASRNVTRYTYEPGASRSTWG